LLKSGFRFHIVIQVQCQKRADFLLGNYKQNLLILVNFSHKKILDKLLLKTKEPHMNTKNL